MLPLLRPATATFRAHRPIAGAVPVLYVRTSLDARIENFPRGPVGGFETWDALAPVLLYNTLTSAVLERQGDAIRFSRPRWTSTRTTGSGRALWR